MLEFGIVKLTIHQALNQGLYALKVGKFKNAEKIFRSILESQPNNLDANNNFGLALYKLQKYEDAINIFKKVIDIDPFFVLAYSNLGASLKAQGKLDKAKAIYDKAIKIKPDFAQAHNNLGVILEHIENLDGAELSFKKAIKINDNYSEFHYNLGNVLLKLYKFDEAILSFGRAIKLAPNHKQALLNRGQIFFKKSLFNLSLKDFDSCNIEKSKPKSLAALYALGRISDIYDRIKIYSKSDSLNLGVAAFSSFITFKEKKNTEFNFCKNPLNFIAISNLKSQINDYEFFNNDLINELKKIKSSWEPSGKTTIKGFQSNPNLFDNPKGRLKDLKSAIIREIDLYKLKFKNENCAFIEKWPLKKNFACWYVILKKQGHQNAHIHPNGWLSGVVYLKTLPNLKKDEGAIEFSLNSDHYFDLNSPKRLHQPIIGDIVLFPSSLHHRTIPFLANTDRISIAFDLVPI